LVEAASSVGITGELRGSLNVEFSGSTGKEHNMLKAVDVRVTGIVELSLVSLQAVGLLTGLTIMSLAVWPTNQPPSSGHLASEMAESR
jgi:hypothetical protein